MNRLLFYINKPRTSTKLCWFVINITAEDLIGLGFFTEETRYASLLFGLLKQDIAAESASLLELSYRLTRYETTILEREQDAQRMRSQQQFALLYFLGTQTGLNGVQAYNAAGSAIRMNGATLASPGYESVPSDYYAYNFTEYDIANGYGKFAVNDVAISTPYIDKIGLKASELVNSVTVQKHATDLIQKGLRKGELARPFIDGKGKVLLLDQIMRSTNPIFESPTRLKWLVDGNFGTTRGTWELVIDTSTKTIYHLNFVGR